MAVEADEIVAGRIVCCLPFGNVVVVRPLGCTPLFVGGDCPGFPTFFPEAERWPTEERSEKFYVVTVNGQPFADLGEVNQLFERFHFPLSGLPHLLAFVRGRALVREYLKSLRIVWLEVSNPVYFVESCGNEYAPYYDVVTGNFGSRYVGLPRYPTTAWLVGRREQ